MEFTVIDPQGYEITLESRAWCHILSGHPEMARLSDLIRPTIEEPNVIQELEGRPGRFKYYKLTGRSFYTYQDVYLMAIVRRDVATMKGNVITAHIIKEISSQGRILWVKRSSR